MPKPRRGLKVFLGPVNTDFTVWSRLAVRGNFWTVDHGIAPIPRCRMLACNRLFIDPCDGSPVVDYRIENDCVESRTLEAAERGTTTEKRWQRLTPEQLSSHVMADTVVAQWLRRRMGVHRLVRACVSSANNGGQGDSERIAASTCSILANSQLSLCSTDPPSLGFHYNGRRILEHFCRASDDRASEISRR